MRPDEDYAEVDESEPVGASRAMSWMVLGVAVAGFAALAYYAYHSGTKSIDGGDTTVIEADATPIKEAPADPEGEQFPDKDKTIYDVIAPNGQAQTGEKLMPEPERAVAATNVEDSEDDAPVPAAPVAAAPAANTTTFVANAEKTPAPAAEPVQTVSEQTVATTVKPAAEEKSFSSPQMVNEKTLTGKKEAPVATAKTEVKEKPKAEVKKEKPAAKPVAKTAATTGGSYKVQLGAFKSDAEAQAAWKKISAAHGAVLGGTPSIIKAEVNGGTFYRLRAGSYADAAAAKAACGKLGGQACIPVK